jgi:hypothetical protein
MKYVTPREGIQLARSTSCILYVLAWKFASTTSDSTKASEVNVTAMILMVRVSCGGTNSIKRMAPITGV